jgi:hypothetical protein
VTPQDDAEARRGRTLDMLAAERVPFHPGLARLPAEAEVRLPGAEQIVLRALALALIGCEATGMAAGTVDLLIDLYRPPFSPAEWRWFESPGRDPAVTRNFGWRFEAALPLLWSVGLAPALPRPEAQTEPFAILEPLVHFRREELLARAAPRPAAEVLDSADLHFCYQCASILDLDSGQAPLPPLDWGVVVERHRAFTWLIEGGGDWDDVVARA